MTEYIRKTIEMHPDFVELLNLMKAHYKLDNQTQVIQKAVKLLAVAMDHKLYVATDSDQIKELEING